MTTTQRPYEALPEFIKKVVDKEIEFALQEEIEHAKKRIDERKSQIIAGVLLHIQKQIMFTTMDNKLIIEVINK